MVYKRRKIMTLEICKELIILANEFPINHFVYKGFMWQLKKDSVFYCLFRKGYNTSYRVLDTQDLLDQLERISE